MSGIKAHTLRVWEQRYNFIQPKRTDTNIRYYDNKDLKLILNISLLKENGFKISKLAQMTLEEMGLEVLKITEKNLRYPDQIHALTIAMVDMEEERFEKVMATNILQIGFERTMMNIIYPFLTKIGVLWQTGSINPAQEHFISNLIRQKLIVAIDGQFVNSDNYSKKYLMFLPEGELHELSLLFAHYIAKSRKNKVIYFGQSLPFEDLESVYKYHKPDILHSVLTSVPSGNQVQKYANRLAETFSESTILLTGYQVIGQDLDLPDNVVILNKLEDFIGYVEENSLEAVSNS